jgi:hypothetical protein
MTLSRRQALLGLLGVGAAGAVTWHLWPAELYEETAPSPFTPARRAAIAAACERVLPGAVAAGVPLFFDSWLVREPFVDLVLAGFEVGADELDSLAQQGHGAVFSELPPEHQDAILGRFQRAELKRPKFSGRGFFEQLVNLTLEGYLGDPRYGGNGEGVGWELSSREHHFWAPPGLGVGAEPATQE